MRTESIGQILLKETDLSAEQLDHALHLQKTRRPYGEIGQILIEKGFITPAQLCRGLARQWDIPYLETISPDLLSAELLKDLPLEFLKKHCLLPLKDSNQRITIALADPLNMEAYDAVQNRLGCYCPRVVSSPTQIEQAISRCYYRNLEQDSSDETEPSEQKSDDSPASNIMAQAPQEDLLAINTGKQAPIVKMVNNILFQAVNHRSSDIHIEPYEDEVKVRFRIDGVLHDIFTPPREQIDALISRLKIMANLNIAERRLPQDGQSRIKIGSQELDIRVSIIPTAGGERVVLRLLDKGGPGLTLEQIGFAPDINNSFQNLITSPHGIILLTGPTGSGKTTTLYCAVNELNTNELNILTVEDPIEYHLPGIGQMQVKPKINLTFANCLRHILRQDPDIIMIGEIRDLETAEIAVHASLTGHLVLSTLHTNDSASAVTRLVDMGIEPYLISSSLVAVMAQRLLRVICPHCKTPCKIEDDLHTLGGFHVQNYDDLQFYTGAGCPQCLQTGYLGRTGIFELLIMDEDIKELIARRAPSHIIKNIALKKGMRTLRDDGLRQARSGFTTLAEVLRVTQDTITPDVRTTEHVGI